MRNEEASLTLAADGVLSLVGVLDYRSGPALREQGRQLITGCTQASVLLDCAGVSKSSSVGLALLLAFMRDARSAGKTAARSRQESGQACSIPASGAC